MPHEDYPIMGIQPDWVLEPEALGSKTKFWFRRGEDEPPWLFKFPEENTGQHWAEKIAAEVANALGILHALTELAEFQGVEGSAAESFTPKGMELFLGNQILAGKVLGYDPSKKFRQSQHTLENIFTAIERGFREEVAINRTKAQLAEYLVLDAVVGNTDRHHENWGILRRREGDHWRARLAPSFDHASSLGRELLDTGKGKSREQLLKDGRIGQYSEKARGGVFWQATDKRGLSPLDLVRKAARLHPNYFRAALARLDLLQREQLSSTIDPVPSGWMTPVQRKFALAG